MTDLMIIELFENGNWKEILFKELKDGDRFRMLDPDTKDLFIGDNNKTEFIATSDPYENEDGILTITIWAGDV